MIVGCDNGATRGCADVGETCCRGGIGTDGAEVRVRQGWSGRLEQGGA